MASSIPVAGMDPPHLEAHRSRGKASGGRVAAGVTIGAIVLSACHALLLARGAHWATPLLLIDWLFNLAFAAGILTLALALGRRLGAPVLGLSDNATVETLCATAMGMALLSLGILLAGLLHLLYGPVLLLASIALTIWLRHELLAIWQQVRSLGAASGRKHPATLITPGQHVLLAILLVTLLFVCLRDTIPLVADTPDLDGVTYHVSALHFYLDAGRVLPLPDIPLANAPSATEMLALPGLAAGSDTQLKVIDLLCALLLGLATFSFSRRHFGEAPALFGVFLLFSPIWVVELMPATVPDFATAFPIVLGVSDALAWLGARKPLNPRTLVAPRIVTADRLLIRAGLMIGISISAKLTSAPALPALAFALGLTLLASRVLPPRVRIIAAIRTGLLLCVPALVPLAPWLLKNLFFFGNPLYPAGGVANGDVCASDTATCGRAAGHTITQLSGPAGHLISLVITGLQVYWQYAGPLSVALLAAPLLLHRVQDRAVMLFLVLGTLLWLELVPLFFPPRYWLGMIAIAQAVSAATIWDLLRRLPLPHRLRELPLLLYLLPTALITLILAMGLAQKDGAFRLAGGTLSPYSYLDERVRPYRALEWINTHTPSTSEIVTVHTSFGYYLHRPYLNDWYGTRFNRLQAGGQARQREFAAWCAAGVRYAVFNLGRTEYNPDYAAAIQPLAAYTWTRQPGLDAHTLFAWRGVNVLAVHPCILPSAGHA